MIHNVQPEKTFLNLKELNEMISVLFDKIFKIIWYFSLDGRVSVEQYPKSKDKYREKWQFIELN